MKIYRKIKSYVKSLVSESKREKLIPITKAIYENHMLEGKIALITGGSSGIGLEIAKLFVENGAKVIITGTNEDKLINALTYINSTYAKAIVMDVTKVSEINNKIEECIGYFEEKRIDVLVNSAGVVAKTDFFGITENDYDKIMDTNAKGTFFVSQCIAKHMIKNNVKGHILNVSSSSALRPAYTPYEMSKWAINGFTKGLSRSLLEYGIIVNAIAPGQTATPMMNRNCNDDLSNKDVICGRYIVPLEIANIALILCSDMGNMMIGETYYVTGGSGVITSDK